MKKEVHITETEWKVMELLWRRPMLNIGEVREALAETGWSDSTIKTLVRRLCSKGAVGIDKSETQFRYYSVLEENTCRRREAKSLIDRIYHGSLKMMVTNLVSDSELSGEETRQLMKIIEKMDGGKGDDTAY